MQTDLWGHFGQLVEPPTRLLVTVMVHNADGTATVSSASGAVFRVRGRLEVATPYNAWVEAGRIVDPAPNFTIYEVTV